MRALFFILFSTFFLVACKKEQPTTKDSWVKISERVQYQFNADHFVLKSGSFENRISKSKLPFKNVILLNSSLSGYFTELNLEEKIKGISSPEYIYSDKIHHLIQNKKLANVGNEQKYDVEKIIALKPDAVFTNYVPNFQNTYDLLKQQGIEIIFLDDYLEQKPLDKSRYLLLFGALFGVKDDAEKLYKSIETQYFNYRDLAQKSLNKPVVLYNEMYGNQWFLPGGSTAAALLIKDANADYILRDNSDITSVSMSFEEVYAKTKTAKFWVNVSSHRSKRELLTINPNYEKLNVYNKGKIYMINNREKGLANDFFISGVVRADLVLKDYIRIFHPQIFPNDPLYYFKELN